MGAGYRAGCEGKGESMRAGYEVKCEDEDGV